MADCEKDGICRVEEELQTWMLETRKFRDGLVLREEKQLNAIASIQTTVTQLEALMRGVMGQKGIVALVTEAKENHDKNAEEIQEIKTRLALGEKQFNDLTTSMNKVTEKVSGIERHIYLALGAVFIIGWFLDKIASPAIDDFRDKRKHVEVSK